MWWERQGGYACKLVTLLVDLLGWMDGWMDGWMSGFMIIFKFGLMFKFGFNVKFRFMSHSSSGSSSTLSRGFFFSVTFDGFWLGWMTLLLLSLLSLLLSLLSLPPPLLLSLLVGHELPDQESEMRLNSSENRIEYCNFRMGDGRWKVVE